MLKAMKSKIRMRIPSFIIVLICIITISCIDEIELDIPKDQTDAFFIEGSLISGNNEDYIEVIIDRVFDFENASRKTIGVTSVVVSNDLNESISLRRSNVTLFRIEITNDANFSVGEGVKYKLNVILDNGEEFESDYSELRSAIQPSSFSQEVVFREYFNDPLRPTNGRVIEEFDLKVSSPLPSIGGIVWVINKIYKVTDSPYPGGSGAEYEMTRKACYLTERLSIDDIYVLDESTVAEDGVEDFTIVSDQMSYYYDEGLMFSVSQRVVDSETIAYLSAIERLIDVGESIFDERPGRLLLGNMKSVNSETAQVFGHFYAAGEHLTYVKASAETIGIRDQYCPPDIACMGPGGCCWGICCDCDDHPNSTNEKPSWWID